MTSKELDAALRDIFRPPSRELQVAAADRIKDLAYVVEAVAVRCDGITLVNKAYAERIEELERENSLQKDVILDLQAADKRLHAVLEEVLGSNALVVPIKNGTLVAHTH